ncbi:MAG: hypothetical protein UY22_C0015G0025 [Candidatus Amesbacteria bacterium GW2011_GWC1_48_10]|uniref:Uncharacterized protein n=1 Tax=Candidatus Amesbacteria bacterium GW2011_GWC1_48_10 TaxID=1618365 RepID=A0A0G1UJ95_9BACT|nr:MAG: hypothetical protein UY22_C0015G0025 [Candidatus Amesbacteria bacterium GW2011_GWC1_48_10]
MRALGGEYLGFIRLGEMGCENPLSKGFHPVHVEDRVRNRRFSRIGRARALARVRHEYARRNLGSPVRRLKVLV